MSDIRAFLDYTRAELIEIAFDTNPALDNFEEEPDLSSAPVELEIVRGLAFNVDGATLRCQCKVEVSFEVHIAESIEYGTSVEALDNDGLLAARGRCGISGGAFCDLDDGDQEGLQKKVLAANTIAYLWGKIRDWVELISLSSPLGRVALPAIDPFALVGELVEGDEDGM